MAAYIALFSIVLVLLAIQDVSAGSLQHGALLEKINNDVKSALTAVKDATTKEITAHKKNVNDQKDKISNLKRDLEDKKKAFDKAGYAVKDADAEVEILREKVEEARTKFNSASDTLGGIRCGSTKSCKYVKRSAPSVSQRIGLDEMRAKQFLVRKRRWGWNPAETVEEGRESLSERASEVGEAAKATANLAIERTREAAVRTANFAKERTREVAAAAAASAIHRGKRTAAYAACNSHNAAIETCKKTFEDLARTVRVLSNDVRLAEVPFLAAKGVLAEAEVTVRTSKVIMDVASALLTEAEGVLEDYVQALKDVKQANKFGLNIVQKVAEFGLNGIIDVKKLTFDSELSKMQGGKFDGKITVKILGLETTFSIRMNLKDTADLIATLLDKVKDRLL